MLGIKFIGISRLQDIKCSLILWKRKKLPPEKFYCWTVCYTVLGLLLTLAHFMLETPRFCSASPYAKTKNNLYSYIQLSRKKKLTETMSYAFIHKPANQCTQPTWKNQNELSVHSQRFMHWKLCSGKAIPRRKGEAIFSSQTQVRADFNSTVTICTSWVPGWLFGSGSWSTQTLQQPLPFRDTVDAWSHCHKDPLAYLARPSLLLLWELKTLIEMWTTVSLSTKKCCASGIDQSHHMGNHQGRGVPWGKFPADILPPEVQSTKVSPAEKVGSCP